MEVLPSSGSQPAASPLVAGNITPVRAEQYPTAIRESGIGLFEGAGRFFGGVLAPFIMSFTLAHIGVPGSYIFVALVALAGLATVAWLGTETKGRIHV